MSKKNKTKNKHKEPAAYPIVVAKPRLAVISAPRLSPTILPEIEDRRTWNPTKKIARPASIRKDQARVTLKSPRAKHLQTKTPIGFAVPEKVALCVRRNIRKEVLHAKKIAGKSGLKRPRRNYWSSIKC